METLEQIKALTEVLQLTQQSSLMVIKVLEQELEKVLKN